MSNEALDSLVEKFNSGDAEAIALAFRAHEAYLRMIVRRQLSSRLRAKFDSIDIVHSVWVRLLPGFYAGRWRFTDAAELRAFLVRATRNHLVNRIHHAVLEFGGRCVKVLPSNPHPSRASPPEESVAAEELWQELLALCPPTHYQLLQLKREGISLEQIAARTGLHKSSVRRILYDLMRRFQAQRRTQADSLKGT